MTLKIMTLILMLNLPSWSLAQGNRTNNSDFTTTDRTHLDFSDTMIDGKFQAPQGFFLQGRKSQMMMQMVKLRNKWRSELRNSKSAVKALAR